MLIKSWWRLFKACLFFFFVSQANMPSVTAHNKMLCSLTDKKFKNVTSTVPKCALQHHLHALKQSAHGMLWEGQTKTQMPVSLRPTHLHWCGPKSNRKFRICIIKSIFRPDFGLLSLLTPSKALTVSSLPDGPDSQVPTNAAFPSF